MSKRPRYLLSECCCAYVVVPVEVTAHLLVYADGKISASLADTMRGFRRASQMVGADIAEAYCSECGAAVAVEEDGE